MRRRETSNNDLNNTSNGYYNNGGNNAAYGNASSPYGNASYGNASYGGGGATYGGNNNNNAYSNPGYVRSDSSSSLQTVSSYGSNAQPKSSYTSGLPHAYNSKDKRKGSGGGSSLSFAMSVMFALVCTLLAFYQRSSYKSVLAGFDNARSVQDAYDKYEAKRREKNSAEGDARYFNRDVTKNKSILSSLEKKSREYSTEIASLEVKHASSVASAVGKSVSDTKKHGETKQKLALAEAESDYRSKREIAWQDQVYILQNATQRDSYRMVVERFGNGPHHVELKLKLGPGDGGFVKLEMAPLGMVPHAVHFFLEQVYHELWDGAYFFLNGPHILQAGPIDYVDDDHANLSPLSRFKEAKLDQLTYPDYSPQFPHTAWTLGFTGRPGGPDFYINKVDNSRHHGPHGQNQYGLAEQADSCFAKVIDGFDVLQRIFTEKKGNDPQNSDFPYMMDDPVEIMTARVVDSVIEDKIQKPDKAMYGNRRKNPAQRKKPIKPQRTAINQETRDERIEKNAR